MEELAEMKADTAAMDTHNDLAGGAEALEPTLFEEYYDDWAAFDLAVAHAIEMHHPIRKRSSLTFEVYNRTVSKGRHDRKPIAEFVSKTFKCTHGIKFRSRGTGKRLRHKLRDIGCPFHVYASAVEHGASYRVKVRQQDKHNHPIGPDAAKCVSTLHESDYDLDNDSDPQATMEDSSPVAAGISSMDSELHGHDTYAQVGQVHNSLHEHANAADILDAGVHESDSLLDSAIDTHISDFTTAAEVAAATAASASASSSPASRLLGPPDHPQQQHEQRQTFKFEESTTLENVRQMMAQFAAERDWDQFHTPRNLVLALTGEVGELCECFQWKGDDQRVEDWTPEERVHLGEEMSDVMLYLVRLADKCNVDLPVAIHDKMIKNARKYPKDQVKGSSKKYNEYKRPRLDKEESL